MPPMPSKDQNVICAFSKFLLQAMCFFKDIKKSQKVKGVKSTHESRLRVWYLKIFRNTFGCSFGSLHVNNFCWITCKSPSSFAESFNFIFYSDPATLHLCNFDTLEAPNFFYYKALIFFCYSLISNELIWLSEQNRLE